MPYTLQKDGDKYCVHRENEDGSAGERVKCHPSEAEAKTHMRALYANVEEAAAKYFMLSFGTVKAVGDWELDVLAIPFNSKDSDGQWFDENTDIMHDTFTTPLIVYQHGIKQGAKGMEDKPIVVGKAVPGTLTKQHDGWHVRVILDKAIKVAKDIYEAAKRGFAAVSSGAISHLARLDIGGRLIPYEKDRPGRIAVWSLAEISLWEMGNGNVSPANRFAVALPAMKAIYRDAGVPFPDISKTDGGLPEADEAAKRARRLEIEKSKNLLKRTDKWF